MSSVLTDLAEIFDDYFLSKQMANELDETVHRLSKANKWIAMLVIFLCPPLAFLPTRALMTARRSP